jgi:MFS family permease
MSRFDTLRDHDFRQLFLADGISQFGTQVSQLALPLVAVVTLRAGPFAVGVLATCQYLGFLLVGLPAGAWVDRLRRRPVLIVADLGRAAALATVPLAWWAGGLSMPQLDAVALTVGVLTVFFEVAYQSYLPHLVGRERLVAGNANLEAVRNVNLIGGPAAGGVLVRVLGAPAAVLIDAVSFAWSALLLGRIRRGEERPARSPQAHLVREIAEGLRFVLGHRELRAIALTTGSSNLFGGIVMALAVLMLARTVGLSPALIGLVYAVAAVGAFAGALAAGPVTTRLGTGRTIWISMAVTTPFALPLAAVRPGWSVWAAAGCWSVAWFGTVVYNIAQVSYRQLITPDELLGRMNASIRFLVWGTLPVGTVLGGVLGQYLGIRAALWIGVIGSVFCFLPAFLSPLRHRAAVPAPVSA